MKPRTSNRQPPTPDDNSRKPLKGWSSVQLSLLVGFAALFISFCTLSASAAGNARHIVVIVWDGMRPDFISQEHTPTLWQLAQDGVIFANHHPVYPSSTEVNGTAIATGAYPQNSGIIANIEYRPALNPLRAVDTQDVNTIRKGDNISDMHYLLRATVAEILQAAGRPTAIAGSKAVALLHDRRERPADQHAGVILFEGKVLPPSLQATITNALGKFPSAESTRSLRPNEARDEWTTRALLGPLWSNGVPAYSLLWLSEPDFSQHPAAPGSPKALAAFESSDRKLAAVLAELERRKLRDKTDVFVVSDHGFSTVERGVDVCAELQKAGFPAQRAFTSPPQPGQILVNGVGGSVLLYIVGHDEAMSRKLVEFLQKQDFTGVILARDKMEGAFALSEANVNSAAAPDVMFAFRWSTNTSRVGAPGMLIVDGGRNTSGGAHSSLSRFDMHNTLVAAGPDLKLGFADNMPTGNTDLAPTILWLLGVKPEGPMDGRVLSEALTVEAPPVSKPLVRRLEANGRIGDGTWTQYLQISQVNDTIYFDEGNGGLVPAK
jgi:predicted AlkP superfamily pyrophosphatase or phosphodiesterase